MKFFAQVGSDDIFWDLTNSLITARQDNFEEVKHLFVCRVMQFSIKSDKIKFLSIHIEYLITWIRIKKIQ